MNRKNITVSLLAIIAIILFGGCIYLYQETTKPAFNVSIGIPRDESVVEFGSPIDDKSVVNNILLNLIGAETITQPSITETLPDANIRIDDTKMGVCYLWLKVWTSENEVILLAGENGEEGASYKKIEGDSVKNIIEYISKYKYSG
ncbi:MAG: hypothetical protein ACRCTZ_23805 [Sarcina sp.]